jgi:hypothetical protein
VEPERGHSKRAEGSETPAVRSGDTVELEGGERRRERRKEKREIRTEVVSYRILDLIDFGKRPPGVIGSK